MNRSKKMLDNQVRITFEIFDTEEQAMEFCKQKNEKPAIHSSYIAHYTPWCGMNGKEVGFVAWYAE